MTAILAFLTGNIWRTAALCLLLAGLSAYGFQAWRINALKADHAELKVTLANERAEAAKTLAEHEASAREKERQLNERAAKVAEEYERELQDTKAAADRVAADLRAGNLRLHERWRSCSAAASVSDPAADPAAADGGADDRAESASRAIAAAAACDAQVRGLQGLLRAEREQGGTPSAD